MNRLLHVAIAALPILLSPLLLFSLAEGLINFGGGEKDVLLVIPYFIWSLVFFICAIVLIVKKWSFMRWVRRATTVSFALLLICGIVTYLTSWLGIK